MYVRVSLFAQTPISVLPTVQRAALPFARPTLHSALCPSVPLPLLLSLLRLLWLSHTA